MSKIRILKSWNSVFAENSLHAITLKLLYGSNFAKSNNYLEASCQVDRLDDLKQATWTLWDTDIFTYLDWPHIWSDLNLQNVG